MNLLNRVRALGFLVILLAAILTASHCLAAVSIHSKTSKNLDNIFAAAYGQPSQATIQAAIKAIGGHERTLVLSPGEWVIPEKMDIPANITLQVERGAKIKINIPRQKIEGITRSYRPVVTWKAHGLKNGDYVYFTGISQVEWENLNFRIFPIIDATENNFKIEFDASKFTSDYRPLKDPGTYAKVLRVAGPFEAGLWQVFEGQGAVALEKRELIYTDWFGVDSTKEDNAPFLQKAITSCVSNGKIILTQPPKSEYYRIMDSIVLHSNMTIEGDYGYEPAILFKPSTGGKYCFLVRGEKYVRLQDISILGDARFNNIAAGAISLSKGGKSPLWKQSAFITLDGLEIKGFFNHDATLIKMEDTIDVIINNCKVKCGNRDAAFGISMGPLVTNKIIISNSNIVGARIAGVRLSMGSGISIEGNDISENSYGISIEPGIHDSGSILISGSSFEGNKIADIFVDKDVQKGITILGTVHCGGGGPNTIGLDINSSGVSVINPTVASDYSSGVFCRLGPASTDNVLLGGKKRPVVTATKMVADEGQGNTFINFLGEQFTKVFPIPLGGATDNSGTIGGNPLTFEGYWGIPLPEGQETEIIIPPFKIPSDLVKSTPSDSNVVFVFNGFMETATSGELECGLQSIFSQPGEPWKKSSSSIINKIKIPPTPKTMFEVRFTSGNFAKLSREGLINLKFIRKAGGASGNFRLVGAWMEYPGNH